MEKPYNAAIAEALADDEIPYPIRWAQLIDIIVRRFELDAAYAAGETERQWHLTSDFDEFVSGLVSYEGPDRAERIAAAFDEHLSKYIILTPF